VRFRAPVSFANLIVAEFADAGKRVIRVCQRNVEMSPSVQSRNVLFATPRLRVRVNLRVPVKRRRAMVATNPIKGSRPELIRTMSESVFLPARSSTWASGPTDGRRSVSAPGSGWQFSHIGP